MTPLHEFTNQMDQDVKDPLDILYEESRVDERVSKIEDLNEVELAHYKVVCANERRKYRI